MGKVIVYIASSLDGYIARKNGDISWLTAYEGQNEDYEYGEFIASVGTLIMGVTTYKQALTFGEWPYGNKKTYVLGKREPVSVPDANIEFYSGDLSQLLNTVRAGSRENVWIVGGGLVISSFLNASLVDELMLFIVPIILAEGIPLFVNLSDEISLSLLTAKSYSSGIAQLHYKVA